MANCSVSTLMQGSAGFESVTVSPLKMTRLALLCQILQKLNPVATCDVPTLLQNAKCFCAVTTSTFEQVELQLLCEINAVAGTGGGGGGGGTLGGTGSPVGVVTPTSSFSFFIQTDSVPPGLVWEWYGGAWHQ